MGRIAELSALLHGPGEERILLHASAADGKLAIDFMKKRHGEMNPPSKRKKIKVNTALILHGRGRSVNEGEMTKHETRTM